MVGVSSDPGCYKSFPHGKKHTYDNKPLLGHIFQVQKKNKMQKMVSSKLMFGKKKGTKTVEQAQQKV